MCLGLDPKEEEICRSKKLQGPDGSRTDPTNALGELWPRGLHHEASLEGRRTPLPGLLGLPRLGLCRGSVLGQRAGARAGETRVNGFDSRQGKSNVQTRILSPALISPADGPRACFSL